MSNGLTSSLVPAVSVQAGQPAANNMTQAPASLLNQSQLVTTQQVAQNSQLAALMNNYHGSNISAYNTQSKNLNKAIPLEIRFLTSTENPNPQYRITNLDTNDQNVIIGSVLGLTGAYAFYNQPVSGFDSPNMKDQYGFNMRALQGFNSLVNYSPLVLTVLQLISTDINQVQTQFTYNDLCYDSKYNGVNMNTNSTFSRYDTNDTLVKLGGLWPVGPQTNISFTSYNYGSGPAVPFTLTLTFNAINSVKNFRMVQ